MSPKTFDSKRSQPKSGNDTVCFTCITYIQGGIILFFINYSGKVGISCRFVYIFAVRRQALYGYCKGQHI